MSRRRAPELPACLRTGLLGAVLGVLACASPSEQPPLEFEFDGCLYVMAPVERPICVLDGEEASLRLWVRSVSGAAVEVTAGADSRLSSEAEPVQGGYLFHLEQVEASEIVVRAAERRRTLRLERGPPAACELEALKREALARWRREGGDWKASGLAEVVRAYNDQGRRSDLIALLGSVHFYLYSEFDSPEEAAEILTEMPEMPAGDGRSAFFTAFYRGSWAARSGRFSNALLELRTARRQAERLAMGWGVSLAEQDLAHVLVRLGRYEQARELLSRLRQEADGGGIEGCGLADLLNDVGWSELLMLEAGLDVDPVPALRQARLALESCEDRKDKRTWNVEINLALAELARGRPGEAREPLAAARRLDPEIWWSRAWQRETEARLALAEGRNVGAQELFEALRKAPEARFNAGLEWRAAVGTARALEAQGKTEDALAAYAEAEKLAFQASLSAPFDESGSGRLYQRETRYHLELLVKLGRLEDALQVARRSLGRHLRRLALGSRLRESEPDRKGQWDLLVQRYWSLTARIHRLIREEEGAAADRARALREQQERLASQATETFDRALSLLDDGGLGPDAEPPPRRPGELLLVYHPSGRGWIGFAADEHGVAAAEIDAHDEDSAKWLAPFAEPLRRARRIRILPYGKLWRVGFHALPFAGASLLAHAEVVYGLDLPAPRRQGVRSSHALLAWDPESDLAHAGAEVAAVERLLRQRDPPWKVWTETDVEVVRRRLEKAPALFHFAGHGELVGWEALSGLVFEKCFDKDVRLTIRDVLALAAVPEVVVLSACESTLPVALEEPSSLGVGQAFLLAGSRVVVGASEKIDDAEARDALELFYQGLDGADSAAAALRAAQLEPGSSPEWMKLRVVER